ncbi:flagellar hook assembly protein FlgD [Leifsonia shinshuensis]|uniref:Flagellar hook capping protein n=1 Tax=Leifsonia shinshuensis TaxID=150026 RepID=A0A7G6YCQ3_9MICO|nr:flagellar hook capping FlgD N-terminal domain-containing protein [Leifsonia shinshuensis]QNE36268.1 flagellar hook capping protein [Leifsonia shinshuensis]
MVNPVSTTATDPTATTSLWSTQPTRAPHQSLTADDFMQLLVTQLKNQDPSSPMDSAAMVQQTTQLGMMQQMTAIGSSSNTALNLQMQTAAADLIGKTVIYNDAAGKSQTGVVTGVSFSGATPTVSVNGGTFPLSGILGVQQTPAS